MEADVDGYYLWICVQSGHGMYYTDDLVYSRICAVGRTDFHGGDLTASAIREIMRSRIAKVIQELMVES